MKRHQHFRLLIAVLIASSATIVGAQDQAKPRKLEAAKLGSTPNVHAFGKTLLCGQPTAEALASAKERGIKVVVTLREDGEIDWDEAAAAKSLGLDYLQLGFRAPETLTDEVLDRARKVLGNAEKKPVLLHCGSANRVGAIWAAFRTLDQGLSLEDALKEAKEVGLRTPGYEVKVRDYVQRKQKAS